MASYQVYSGYLKNKLVAADFLAERMLEGKPFYVAFKELKERAKELGIVKTEFRITQVEYGRLKWLAFQEYEWKLKQRKQQ